MRRRSTWMGLAAAAGVAWAAGPAAAQTAPVPIALRGTAAPAGGTYNDFGVPVLNGSGQVAFVAGLVGSSTAGLFAGSPGALQTVALDGQTAPGGGAYTNFNDVLGLGGTGQVGYVAGLTGGSGFQGIYAGAPGSVQAAAVLGQAAPAGGNYMFFGTPVLNGSGQVAFQANLTGVPGNQGLFAGAPGAVQAVVLQGQTAPAGGIYDGISPTTALNGSGQVAFFSTLTGGSSGQGLFAGAPGAVQAAALLGQAAPAGGNYLAFGSVPALNGSGQVAFFASLTGGSSTSGLFAGAPGSVQAVALRGQTAPAGGTYGFFGDPSLNGAGQVAFQVTLTGGSSTRGVFAGSPGALQAAALQGQAAPGGDTFTANFADPALNGSGQVAFFGQVTGTGVTTANDRGLYVWTAGTLVKVVREGDVVDVDPTAGTDLRTVADGGILFLAPSSGGQDGRGVGFADDGRLVYTLAFTDNSRGVFVSVVPVPEPAAGLAAVAVGLAAVGAVRRRTRRGG